MKNKSIIFIEDLAANAWQPESKQIAGGWLLRYSRGITRRGNSVLPLKDDGQINLNKKITIAEDFYSQYNLPLIFQMTKAAQPNGLNRTLKSLGYQDKFFTQVQTGSTKIVLKNTQGEKRFSVTGTPKLNLEWFNIYTQTNQYSGLSSEVRENILRQTPQNSCYLTLKDGNHIAAIGLGVIECDHMGIYCMVTPNEHRRKGAAIETIHALAKWGVNNFVHQIYLQVMENNRPALALYAKAGFTKQYRYWYTEKSI